MTNSGNPTQTAEPNAPAVVKFNGPKEVLIAARKLIEKPEKWAQGAAVKFGGSPFCSATAIDRASRFAWPAQAFDALCRAVGVIGMPGLIEWNDAPERTHAEVLAAFHRAIEQCAEGDQSCDAASTKEA